MAMIATIIVSTEPSRSAGFRNAPTSRSCALVIQPGDARGISCCSPNSAFRKSGSSVNENTSSAAAMTFDATVPTIRQACGRR